eukprot:g6012.t1
MASPNPLFLFLLFELLILSLSAVVRTNFCDVGEYSPSQSKVGRGSCVKCPAGQFSKGTEVVRSETVNVFQCKTCVLGKVTTLPSGNSECKECGIGSMALDHLSCVACEAGKSQKYPGSKHCNNCVYGKYSFPAGSSECRDCPVGKFQANESQSECHSCPKGRYTSHGLSGLGHHVCNICPSGQFMDIEGHVFDSTKSRIECKLCEGGKVSDDNRTRCETVKFDMHEEL